MPFKERFSGLFDLAENKRRCSINKRIRMGKKVVNEVVCLVRRVSGGCSERLTSLLGVDFTSLFLLHD